MQRLRFLHRGVVFGIGKKTSAVLRRALGHVNLPTWYLDTLVVGSEDYLPDPFGA